MFSRLIGLIGGLFLGLLGASLAATAIAADRTVKASPATLLLTEQFVMHSKHSKRDYLIQVAKSPRLLRNGEKAAALYVLDGNGAFGLLTDSVRVLESGPAISLAYVIAIGYPYIEKSGDRDRLIDMAHVQGDIRGTKLGGGGAAFEAFILDELKPLIESRYPVDRDRSVLIGHSLGGLFATTVLANHPEAFGGYLILSPSLQFDPSLLERVAAAATKGAGRRVYISVGSEEGSVAVPAAAALYAALSKPDSKFETRYCNVQGYYHMSVTLTPASVALPFLIPPPASPNPAVRRMCPSATISPP